MNGKLCRAPASGGTAHGGLGYVLGYALGQKGEQSRECFYELMREASARDDLGVGAIWKPVAGEGMRPAAIYCKNVTSLATADVEMDAIAAANPRVKQPVMHFVFSVHPDHAPMVSPEKMIRAAERALEKIGLGDHGQVHSVHLDEPHPHVHVIVETTNPQTLKAWDRLRNFPRLSWALREVEQEMNLPRDRGLAVTRELTDGSLRVEWATRAERETWARERQDDRFDYLARRYMGDYRSFETAETWVRDVVATRIAERLDALEQRGEKLSWAEVHTIAAEDGVLLRKGDDGTIVAAIYDRVTDDERGSGERATPTDEVAVRRDAFGAPVPAREQRSRDTGIEVVIDADMLGGRRRAALLEAFRDVQQAEQDFIAQVRSDPALVSRAVIAGGRAAYTREDVDSYLAARIGDATDVLAMSQYVERNDVTLRVLSADTTNPLFTTEAQLLKEKRLETAALTLAQQADPKYDQAALEKAIADFETEKGFNISLQQRAALDTLRYRLGWMQGDAGTGKTTMMQITRRYAELTGRGVVGITTSQSAAEKLQHAAGFEAVNAARLGVQERHGRSVSGAQVLDEASMTDIDAVQRAIDRATEHGTIVMGIGDGAQLSSIGAGDAHAIMCRVAQEAGTYAELSEVRRQRDGLAWMREVVPRMGRAIRTQDGASIAACIREIGEHGVFTGCGNRDEMMDAAAVQYLAYASEGVKVLLNTRSKLVAKHLNIAIRRQLGLAGSGVNFPTARGGVREASVGDRIVFLKNNERGVGVLNGYTGTIIDVRLGDDDRWTIEVELDGGRRVAFNPRRYKDWDWGHAVTTHKAQGRDDPANIYVFDRSADARAFHVGLTRAQQHLHAFYNEENFEGIDGIAKHMSERIGTKDDALLFDEIVRRIGGPDTIWAQRVRAARADERDPLRMQYIAAQKERRTRYEVAVAEVHQTFRERSLASANASAAEKKSLSREHAKVTNAILQRNAPQSFVEWAAQQRAEIERNAESNEGTRAVRSQERERQRQHEQHNAFTGVGELADKRSQTRDRSDR